jgi:uncharacterized protein (DUF1800 family)
MYEKSMSSTSFSKAYIAVNRFGYGARGDELIQAQENPKKWIISQLLPITFNSSLAHSNDIFIEHANYRKEKKKQKKRGQQSQSSQTNTEMSKSTIPEDKVSENKILKKESVYIIVGKGLNLLEDVNGSLFIRKNSHQKIKQFQENII